MNIEEAITLIGKKIHGDSKKILPTIPDKFVDLVITDPPYDLDGWEILWFHEQFKRITRNGIIVFCPPENQWMPLPDQYLFWEKPISTKNTSKRYSRFIEMILIYGDVKWNPGRHWSQYTNVFKDLVDDASLHSFRKPPSLIERLILNHTDPFDCILDPFAGSFVIADTAYSLDRSHISIEIDDNLYAKYGDKE